MLSYTSEYLPTSSYDVWVCYWDLAPLSQTCMDFPFEPVNFSPSDRLLIICLKWNTNLVLSNVIYYFRNISITNSSDNSLMIQHLLLQRILHLLLMAETSWNLENFEFQFSWHGKRRSYLALSQISAPSLDNINHRIIL